MDKISSAIKCVNCSSTLSSPVLLPCGHCICKSHADESTGRAACYKCGLQHSNCNFFVVEALNYLIEAKIDTLQFGQSHKEATSSCDELNELISKIDVLHKHPECYVNDMFSEFRRRVDLKSEQLKLKLEQEVHTILVELNKLESECKEKINSRDKSLKFDELIDAKEDAQKQLEAYLSSLAELKLEEAKWKNISKDCHKQIEVLQQRLNDFNEALSANVFDLGTYNIESFTETDIDPNFELWNCKLDSRILTNAIMKKKFVKLCEFAPSTKFELLYRGSRDGFEAKDFHEKCDHRPKTVTIVKTIVTDSVFGGYTEAEWNGKKYGFIRDEKAFLFSLVNQENAPIKIRIGNGYENEAIWNDGDCDCGPVFGENDDGFIIADECNLNKLSKCDLGACFKHPKYDIGSKEAENFLAGSKLFQVAEIEVFQIL